MGCEVMALRRSLSDEALSIVAGALAVNSRAYCSAERSRCPRDLGSAANAL
jgi:hypothetical protein